MDDGSSQNRRPAPRAEAHPFASRPRPLRPDAVTIPSVARRGRTTVRHFVQLLLGGYVSTVETRRQRGERGVAFRIRATLAWTCRLFVDDEIALQPFPVQLRRRMEMLGPTYVKLGQILSLRLDVLPESVTRELRTLLSHLPPVSFDTIREIVEDDLGMRVDQLFAEIDAQPLGSASIAQSHVAVTHAGDRVILKVVKPGIRELLYRDATLLRTLGRVLQMMVPRYQPRRIIDEFCDYTLREVEMLREAENAETFAANFVDMPDVVFPRIYHDLSGPQVLCMEFLDGRQPDREAVETLSADERQRLLEVGAGAIIRMLYEDGFFHADLHPGNLLILPEAKVGFIDLGMVGRLEPQLRSELLNLFYSVVVEDYDNAARHLSNVAMTEAGSDVVAFRRAVRDLCRRWRRSATFEDFSLALLILEAIQLGARYQLYFPVEMVLMVKALVTYEGVGYLLDPEFNVARVSERHVGRIFRHQYAPAQLFREAVRSIPAVVDALTKMPLLVTEGLRVMENQARREPERPLSGMRATILGGFCLLAGAILIVADGPWVVALLLLVLGLALPLRRSR
jgi:ubiquinone biosynthesis protein